MLWINLVVLFFCSVMTAFAVRRYRERRRRPWVVMVGAYVAAVGLSIGSYPIALNAVQQNAVGGYHQYLNGTIVEVPPPDVTICAEDGDCHHTHRCHEYTDTEVTSEIGTDGKSHTVIEEVDKYHQCPEATRETTYSVVDQFGRTYVLGDHVYDAVPQPVSNEFAINPNVFRGVPPQWQHAKDSLASGNSDPVTITGSYDNHILPSENTILREYGGDVDRLKALGLLPPHTAHLDPTGQSLDQTIHDSFLADKVAFVHVTLSPNFRAQWQDAMMRLNAALGSKLQGDMHIVVIRASSLKGVIDPDSYLSALKAYWQSGLGKNALAKNGIVLVLGINDAASRVLWTRATTGMPVGNNGMLYALQYQIENVPFDPSKVIGATAAHVTTVKGKPHVDYTLGHGLIEQIVLHQFPFARACMNCKNRAQPGFTYLDSEIPITPLAIGWAGAADIVVLGIFYLIALAIYDHFSQERRYQPSYPQWR